MWVELLTQRSHANGGVCSGVRSARDDGWICREGGRRGENRRRLTKMTFFNIDILSAKRLRTVILKECKHIYLLCVLYNTMGFSACMLYTSAV